MSSSPASPKKRKVVADSKTSIENIETQICDGITQKTYPHADGCMCVILHPETVKTHLKEQALKGDWNDLRKPDIFLELRQKGIVPCVACMKLLHKQGVQGQQRNDVYIAVKWFHTLMNWWHWTPDQQKTGIVFLKVFANEYGITPDMGLDNYNEVMEEKLNQHHIGYIQMGLKVLECILRIDQPESLDLEEEEEDSDLSESSHDSDSENEDDEDEEN